MQVAGTQNVINLLKSPSTFYNIYLNVIDLY